MTLSWVSDLSKTGTNTCRKNYIREPQSGAAISTLEIQDSFNCIMYFAIPIKFGSLAKTKTGRDNFAPCKNDFFNVTLTAAAAAGEQQDVVQQGGEGLHRAGHVGERGGVQHAVDALHLAGIHDAGSG